MLPFLSSILTPFQEVYKVKFIGLTIYEIIGRIFRYYMHLEIVTIILIIITQKTCIIFKQQAQILSYYLRVYFAIFISLIICFLGILYNDSLESIPHIFHMPLYGNHTPYEAIYTTCNGIYNKYQLILIYINQYLQRTFSKYCN